VSFHVAEREKAQQNHHWQGGNQGGESRGCPRLVCIDLSPSHFGAFRIEPGARSLMRADEPVPLTPKAFDLLLYMVRNAGRLLTKEELLGAVWPDSIVEEGNLSQNVFLLRKALGETSKENRCILTIPGRGYQFAAPLASRGAPVDGARGAYADDGDCRRRVFR
jgi:DNA-binding winged helix-turn-helix (wHTH) protein